MIRLADGNSLDSVMKVAPFISVLIPSYNRARYIIDAIVSVLAQTYSSFEVVVVDDGSTDSTKSIVLSFNDKRLRYILKEHTGAPSTRNRCITEARGDFVLWLDSDDRMLPGTLQRYVQVLQDCPDADVIYGNLEITDASFVRLGIRDYPDWYGRNSELLSEMLLCNSLPNPGTLVRKSCYDRYGMYDESFRRAHDYEFWVRISEEAVFKHAGCTVVQWRWHESNMSSGTVSIDLSYDVRIVKKVLAEHTLQELFLGTDWERNEEAQSAALLKVAHRLIELNAVTEAMNYVRRAYNVNPASGLLALLDNLKKMTDVSNFSPAIDANVPRVSVIVPTYNRPMMLKIALQSIFDQTSQDFEIIVVNDAGEDVAKVVSSFNSPNKITYLSHETNKGLAAARNTGIHAARGKYIAYLDDDDIYYPQHIEILSSYLESHDCKVAYTDSYRATQQLIEGTYRTVARECLYSFDFDYDRILWQNFVPVLCFMHEKECFEQTGLFDENLKRHEDWDLWIRMSRHFHIDHIPSITCEYSHREDGTGMVSGTLPMFLRSFDAVTSKYRDMMVNRKEIQDAVKNSRFMMIYIMFEFLGRKLAALRDSGNLPEKIDELVGLLSATGATNEEIFSACYQESARMEESSDQKKALQCLGRALDLCDYNVFARSKLAELLLENGETEAAIGQMEILFQSNPVESNLLIALAKLYMAQGNSQKVRFFVDRLLAVEPDNQEARNLDVALIPRNNV